MTSKHSEVAESSNHGITRWRVANAAMRTAIVATATEVDRVAHQLDDDSLWLLKAAPGTWKRIDTPNASALANDSAHGPRLPNAVVAANVKEALDAAWINSPENGKPFFVRPSINIASAIGGSLAIQNSIGQITPQGTIIQTYMQSKVRQTVTTTAVPTNIAGVWFTGFSATTGAFFLNTGLRVTYRFGFETLTAAQRAYCGITTAAAPTNVDPASLLSILGVGAPLGSGNLHLYHNDTAGLATDVDLGAAFPVALLACYEVTIYIPAPDVYTNLLTSIYFRVRRIDVKGAVYYYEATSNLPVTWQAYAFSHWITNNTDAAICALSLLGVEGIQPY